MDINKMIIRTGSLAYFDGLRYAVPVKVLSVHGTGELNGSTDLRVLVTGRTSVRTVRCRTASRTKSRRASGT
jgi:hypothetical protein